MAVSRSHDMSYESGPHLVGDRQRDEETVRRYRFHQEPSTASRTSCKAAVPV